MAPNCMQLQGKTYSPQLYTISSEDCISLFRTIHIEIMQGLFDKFIYADTCVKLAKAHNVRIVLEHMNMLGTRGVQITEMFGTILFYTKRNTVHLMHSKLSLFGGVG